MNGPGPGEIPASGPGYVLLEDGSRFDGRICGAAGDGVGEVVFNTAMSGYQESVTDPSYAGQIITYTCPMVGNYGVSTAAMESAGPQARGVIMRDAGNYSDAPTAEIGWLDWLVENGIQAINEVNTRALVRHIRDRGAMRGGIFGAATPVEQALASIGAEPEMAGRNLVRTVTPDSPIEHPGSGPHVVALDTGIKWSIINQFLEHDCRMTLLPCDSPAAEVLARKPDLIFLANGPGDPAALDPLIGTVRELIGKKPMVGICLGHQLFCRAIGLETRKLPFGHRGFNHPVKDLETGRIEITSQNHGFTVTGPDGEERIEGDDPVRWQTPYGEAVLTRISLYDRTVEGLRLPEADAMTVQHHPEAGPGPRDSRGLFDRFLELMN